MSIKFRTLSVALCPNVRVTSEFIFDEEDESLQVAVFVFQNEVEIGNSTEFYRVNSGIVNAPAEHFYSFVRYGAVAILEEHKEHLIQLFDSETLINKVLMPSWMS